MMRNSPAAQGRKLTGWRVLIGGEALTSALCRQALERGIDVFSGYGLSETGPALSFARVPPELAGDPVSEGQYRIKAGLPLPLVDLRGVDAEIHDIPHHGKTASEIVARPPWLNRRYHDAA